jgi:hypothetical protein
MTEPVDYNPETLTFREALGLLHSRERQLFNLIRDIRREPMIESSTFWAQTAETHFKQGFLAMKRALTDPHEE